MTLILSNFHLLQTPNLVIMIPSFLNLKSLVIKGNNLKESLKEDKILNNVKLKKIIKSKQIQKQRRWTLSDWTRTLLMSLLLCLNLHEFLILDNEKITSFLYLLSLS